MKDKIVLITGGSSGIGRATALAFAGKGAKVVVADVNVEGGEETVNLIKAAGGEAAFIKADVSNEEEVKALVEGAVAAFGGLDYGINNAGIEGASAPLHKTEITDWQKTIDVNLTGVFNCIKYEVRYMLAHGGGAIVNTSSIAGLVGSAGLSPYVASKHGVTGLTRAAALEYSGQGIRINSVHPGAIRTPMIDRILVEMPEMADQMATMHPIGRIGEPEEIAHAIVWLCSDEASFVTGHTMTVDGGFVAQ